MISLGAKLCEMSKIKNTIKIKCCSDERQLDRVYVAGWTTSTNTILNTLALLVKLDTGIPYSKSQ